MKTRAGYRVVVGQTGWYPLVRMCACPAAFVQLPICLLLSLNHGNNLELNRYYHLHFTVGKLRPREVE